MRTLVRTEFGTVRLFLIDTAALGSAEMKIKARSSTERNKFSCQQLRVQLLSILWHQRFGLVEMLA